VPASLGDQTQEPAPVDPDDVQADGDPCFGCGRSGETRMCWSQLEGRDVPLCPRCHPSADVGDDTGADGEEPEAVASPEAMESLTAAPPQTTGPAAVPPRLFAEGRRAYERYVLDDDGMTRRTTPDPTNGEADTAIMRRVGGAR
jgi:hypothetical protein